VCTCVLNEAIDLSFSRVSSWCAREQDSVCLYVYVYLNEANGCERGSKSIDKHRHRTETDCLVYMRKESV
jgi:hypothetical protein